MTRVAIYARVSSKAQRDKHTIDGQLHVLTAYANAQGWEIVDTYLDDGRSAKTGRGLDDRAGFRTLVVDAARQRFDVVLVVAIDRLTRTEDLLEQAEILAPLQRAGVQIVTPASGALDLRTMFGRLWTVMQAFVGAEENRVRSERIKAGKVRSIAHGRKPAGPTPYGLRYDKATGEWSLDEVTAPIVREIYRRVAGGEPCARIVDDFARRGLPTALGKERGWSTDLAYRLLSGRHTRGVWVVNKNTGASIDVPRIVTEEEWAAAKLSLRRTQTSALGRSHHVYLLQGLATCGHCGEPIVVRSGNVYYNAAHERRENPAMYACRGRTRKQGCKAPLVRTRELDDRVWAALCERLDRPDLVRELAEVEADRARDERDWSADAAGYRAHLDRLATVETTITTHYRAGRLTEAVYAEQLEAVLRERRAVRDQLSTAELAAGAHLTSKERLAHARVSVELLRGALPKAMPAQRQALLRELVRDGGAILREGRAELDLRLIRRAAATSRAGAAGAKRGPIVLAPVSD